MPEPTLGRIDTLTGEELAAYRGHPRVSADIVRRWGPPNEHIIRAVLEHHEREQGQGFPQGPAPRATTRGAPGPGAPRGVCRPRQGTPRQGSWGCPTRPRASPCRRAPARG